MSKLLNDGCSPSCPVPPYCKHPTECRNAACDFYESTSSPESPERRLLREARDEFSHLLEYWNRNVNERAMQDACEHTLIEAKEWMVKIDALLASGGQGDDRDDSYAAWHPKMHDDERDNAAGQPRGNPDTDLAPATPTPAATSTPHDFLPGADPSSCGHCGVRIEQHSSAAQEGQAEKDGEELPGMLAVAKAVHEQRWPHTMDAKVWADEFVKVFPDIELGTMIAWFANAIMAGYDTAQANPRSAWPVHQEKDSEGTPTCGICGFSNDKDCPGRQSDYGKCGYIDRLERAHADAIAQWSDAEGRLKAAQIAIENSDTAKYRDALKNILWIKDCGIDSTDEKGVFRNWPESERDAMYYIAKAAIAAPANRSEREGEG